MGTLADRMNGHARADAPISPPTEPTAESTSWRSPQCGGRSHRYCHHSRCDCHCHVRGGAKTSSMDAGRTNTRAVPNYRHTDVGAENDLGQELELAKIASLHLQGYSSAKIAEQMGYSIAKVGASIHTLRRRWANTAVRDIDAAISEELAKISHLESEYWAAWQRSQDVEMPLDEIKRLQRVYGITITPTGDSAFLDGVMKCIDRRIKLLGLDAPMRVDITSKVRLMAEAAGLDPDLAVEEARKVIAEARAEMSARILQEGKDGG